LAVAASVESRLSIADSDIPGSVLYLVFKDLGCGISIDTFDQRKLLQKIVFILQQAGLDLGYSYRWHLSGPYSTDLGQAYYRIAGRQSEYAKRTGNLHLKTEAKAIIGKVRKTLGSGVTDPALLEAISTVLYLNRREIPYLQRLKPGIPEATWKVAFNKVDALSLK